jgi:D-alanyl-D-alanine dipeptidase
MKPKLVSLKKYGFIINNKARKDWTKTKLIFVRESVAKALIRARNYLPEGYNFEIHDGKRSLAQQREIIKICEEDLKKKYPKDWEKRLEIFTGGYKSLKEKLPSNTHRHGGAVDLTILDNKMRELDMGGEDFTKKSRLNYYENKKNLKKREKKIRDNRRLLKKVMVKAGFEPYYPEWNHWGYSK